MPKNSSFPAYFSGFLISGQYYRQKLSPRLRMVCKPFHKAGIAVLASVRAAHIWINGIIADGNIRLCDNAFRIYLFHDHIDAIPLALLRSISLK